MSRFFRSSADDSSSSSGNEDSSVASQDDHLEHHELTRARPAADAQRSSLAQQTGNASHKDILLHALLEQRCMIEVQQEHQWSRRGSAELRAEARARYQRLCADLLPLDLVPAGLDDDRYRDTRQTYRDGLDMLLAEGHPSRHRTAIPRPMNKLLTDSVRPAVLNTVPQNLPLTGPLSFFGLPQQPPVVNSQYLRDFEEVGLLGKGGYGTVYCVKHRLDSRMYAVKKVRIRPSALASIQSGDNHCELEETLVELRTLAQLEHPNVVRYYSSWVEWAAPGSDQTHVDDGSNLGHEADTSDGHHDDERTRSNALRRIITAETNSDTNDGKLVTFGEVSASIGSSRSMHPMQRNTSTSVADADESNVVITFEDSDAARTGAPSMITSSDSSMSEAAVAKVSEPTLALHIQMAVYPMTLAEFLSPNPETKSVDGITPLAHCFHLEISIRIMLALLDGVDYIHSHGIVHRDLKPANIFMRLEKNPRGRQGCVDLMLCSHCRAGKMANPAMVSVCIGDFGLVGRIAQSVDTDKPSTRRQVSPVGTELYRPPTHHHVIGPGLDIFSLGVIAFELLYKFNTQMERRETLQDLRRGQYPAHFPLQAKELIAGMLGHEDSAKITVPDLRHRLSAMLTQ